MLEKTYKYKFTIYLYLYNKCIYHDVCIRIMNSKPVNNLLCQPYTPLDMSDMLLATCIFEICIPTCFIQQEIIFIKKLEAFKFLSLNPLDIFELGARSLNFKQEFRFYFFKRYLMFVLVASLEFEYPSSCSFKLNSRSSCLIFLNYSSVRSIQMLLFGSKHDIKYCISMYGAFKCFYLVLNMISSIEYQCTEHSTAFIWF